MNTLFWIILMTLINGLISLIGIFSFWVEDKKLNKIIFYLVAMSAGALLGGAFFHLLLESFESLSYFTSFFFMIMGLIMFFVIEKFLHWHHCHDDKCKNHPVSNLILIGDSVHNFIDGLIIAASFLIDVKLGLLTSVLIILHEIPQELGNFGVLVYGGFSKNKALFYNFLAQMVSVIGGILGFFLMNSIGFFVPYLLSFAAGGFIYIALSDLVPELHKYVETKKSIYSFLFFLFGIGLMIFFKIIFE